MAILTSGDRIGIEAIPVEIRHYRDAKASVQEAREAAERDHILKALDSSDWNVSAAARASEWNERIYTNGYEHSD